MRTDWKLESSPGFRQYKLLMSVDMTAGKTVNGRRLASTSIAESTHTHTNLLEKGVGPGGWGF